MLLCIVSTLLEAQPSNNEKKVPGIYLEIESRNNINDSISIQLTQIPFPNYTQARDTDNKKLIGDKVAWHFNVQGPVECSAIGLIGERRLYWLLEPGDSVKIVDEKEGVRFYGKGSDKLRLLYELRLLKKSIKKPAKIHFPKTLEEYFELDRYYNEQLKVGVRLIDSYKSKITPFAYLNIKANYIDPIEEDRAEWFLSFAYTNKNSQTISRQSLCEIFDSTARGEYAMWLRTVPDVANGRYEVARIEAYRNLAFNFDHDSLKSEINRRFLYYKHGKKIYTGLAREKFFFDLLVIQTIGEIDITHEVDSLLNMYYKEPGFPEYKKIVKEHEMKARVLHSGALAPDFYLADMTDNPISKSRFKGKVMLLDFWFTGCAGCVQMVPALRHVENALKNDTNIVFLSISVDAKKQKWLKSIEQKKYTTGTGINLYTIGQGSNHPMIRAYNIISYPTLFLIDGFGKIGENPLPDPRKDNGEQLLKIIKRHLARLKDGPYIFRNDNSASIFTTEGSSVSASEIDMSKEPVFEVQTDEYGEFFKVMLQKELKTPPVEYKRPEKILALSDIEGNFDAFRKLLQINKVIDNDFNWAFGEGHLVFLGDMFDRGEQVTECLWLLYSLEEKAKAAGGFMHFILGNHEIMNLQGDHRYVQPKYHESADRLGKKITDLYSTDSELGRWLMNKNILEKIGNLLFVHGGISKDVNELPLSLEQINEIARPFYANAEAMKGSTNENVKIIYDTNDKLSPFWYRNYYLGKEMEIRVGGSKGVDTVFRASDAQVNETMEKFRVKHIITGHTIVADTITCHYNRKVINVDTAHADGKSEALFIEGNKFYRVNDKGQRRLLFEDEPRKEE